MMAMEFAKTTVRVTVMKTTLKHEYRCAFHEEQGFEKRLVQERGWYRPMHNYINPAKKETPHLFKGQQLENELVYRFVIYIGLWV